MKLLVLGASGATGGWLTRMAAQAGHEVTALVRPGATFVPPPNVREVRGEVLDAATLAAALDGQNAIACCLGIRRTGKAPWSALLSPPDLMTRVASLLVSAMPRAGVRRVVAISAGGVAESITQCTGVIRWLAGAGNVGVAYRDLADMETPAVGEPPRLARGATGDAHERRSYRTRSQGGPLWSVLDRAAVGRGGVDAWRPFAADTVCRADCFVGNIHSESRIVGTGNGEQ